MGWDRFAENEPRVPAQLCQPTKKGVGGEQVNRATSVPNELIASRSKLSQPNRCPRGSASSMTRRSSSSASTQTMICCFAQAERKLGGKIKWSVIGRVPASPNESKRVPDEVLLSLGRTGFSTGAGSRQASPTASEWAQIFPHARDSWQVQMFSISLALRMRSPAR